MYNLLRVSKGWIHYAQAYVSRVAHSCGSQNKGEVKLEPYENDWFPLLDDGDPECGIEHPRLEGNYCIKDYGHDDLHEDLAGNEWYGTPR